ncbi:MAG: DUF1338 domain-containing protein [Burkholderiales bacterium]|nr:DUF1338 domain-containing protein [Burkholderiales bacterium]
MELSNLFNNLWQQYTKENSQALEIYNLFTKCGENIINDHIALRTFNDPRVNVDKLGKFFEKLGYQSCGEYEFSEKNLFARHYEHKTDPRQAKVFISELKTENFSPFLQQQAKKCIDKIPDNLLHSQELLYSGAIWGDLDYDIYKQLLTESEYAAWTYAFGYRANHFTVSINELSNRFESIQVVNSFLTQNNFKLNSAGGEVKGTPNELLEQSSTMANKVPVKFKQGTFEILNSYYEFAKRYPQDNGSLYQGFIAKSADKIFESTNINSM